MTNTEGLTEKTTYRNQWNALKAWPEWIDTLIDEAEEVGTFTRGIESDKRQRGSAVNVDVFGYDEAQHLAVIQVRECVFHPRRHNRIRKDYYLIGHTEGGDVFAHAVESPARSKRALATPDGVVAFVLAKVWGCTELQLPDIIRQGDVALVPARLPKTAELMGETEIILRKTHRLKAERLYRDGETVYAYRRVSIVHLRREHQTVQVKSGIYRVVEGHRAATWRFSSPTAD